jgi:ankyrin repeat protein
MSRVRLVLFALFSLGLAVPAAAQFSDNYNFFKAIRDKDAQKALEILNKPGSVIVNARDPDSGDTALHIVTRRRDTPWMNLLLQRGANVDGTDSARNTPLIVAAGSGFTDGIRVLLAYKANVNARNSSGETPVIKAVQAGNVMAVRVLMEAGADPNRSDSVAGLSAKDYAARDRRLSAIAKLLDGPAKKPEAVGPSAP